MILSLIIMSFVSSICCSRVAIIGAGIGGTSTAYFLKKLKQQKVEIDIYESNKVGGRLATFQWEGSNYEIGGSVIHPDNKYMNHFVEELGLEKWHDCSGSFGLFNQNEMLFRTSDYSFITLTKLLWRYGFDLVNLKKFLENLLENFARLYDVTQTGYPAATSNQLLALTGTDAVEFLNISTSEGFEKMGFSKIIVDELVSAIINCNYCQSPGIHLFVGSVAIAGADPNLWSVKGGNFRVAELLVNKSQSSLINKQVKRIKYDNSKFVLSGDFSERIYDYVVLAAPLTNRNEIEFEGFQKEPERENYHKTICTLVEGLIKPKFFNSNDLPDTLLFTDNYKIKALAEIFPVDGDCEIPGVPVWKIFSDEILSKDYLDKIFGNYKVISTTDWLAYPEYSHSAKNKSFYLFDPSINIYYVNAVEALASAMEMSAIGGHNVAYLVSKDIDQVMKGSNNNEEGTFKGHEEL